MVIVWLLYGYCVVRIGNLQDSSRNMCYFFCKDTNKFSNFQFFRGIIFKKNALLSTKNTCTCNITNSLGNFVGVVNE